MNYGTRNKDRLLEATAFRFPSSKNKENKPLYPLAARKKDKLCSKTGSKEGPFSPSFPSHTHHYKFTGPQPRIPPIFASPKNKYMKFYTWLIRYRLYLGLALVVLGIVANIYSSFWPAFPLYFIGLILIVGHFFIGPATYPGIYGRW